jgi:hypothetical protein
MQLVMCMQYVQNFSPIPVDTCRLALSEMWIYLCYSQDLERGQTIPTMGLLPKIGPIGI